MLARSLLGSAAFVDVRGKSISRTLVRCRPTNVSVRNSGSPTAGPRRYKGIPLFGTRVRR